MKRLILSLALASLAACGPSSSEVRRSHHVVYNAPFATVWNAVVTEVTSRYPAIEVEDPIAGRIRTSWRVVTVQDRDVSNTNAAGAPSAASTVGNTSSGTAPGRSTVGQQTNTITGDPSMPGGILVRVWVYVKGPPWRVTVGGEGAEYIVGSPQLRPYRRGAIDEPEWVQARIDAISAAIYHRLQQYAQEDHGAEQAPVAQEEERSPWANLSDPSAALFVGKVRAAAKAKDTAALRALMDAAFTWSAGGAPNADVAITMWKADPTKLAALTKMLDGGCAAGSDDATAVVCPAGAPSSADAAGAHAVFRKLGGAWKFVVFVGE